MTVRHFGGFLDGSMRLLSVEIVNFRVIRKARVEFADLVTGIIGPNGSGKSSIVEAVAWSLYGNRVARSGKDEIRSVFARSSEDCQVALEFSVGQERYRIVRRLAGKAKRPEVVLYRGDKPESVGSTETFHQITRLLGLDWRGFLTSFLARQHELNALADLPPVERREHLAGMLGIERLDKALQKIKEDSRMLRQKADVIQKQVDWRESVSGRVEELGEHILRLEHQRDSSQGAYGAAKDEFKEIEVQHREHQVKQAECSRIEASIKATEKGREHIREQLESLRSREARLIEAQKELAELETSLSDLDPLKKQLEELGEAGKQAALRSDIEVQLDAARQELAITEQRLAVRKTELGSVLEMAGEIPEDVTERHQTARTELEQVRKEWTESKANLRVNQRENSRLRSQIESISKIGPDTVCDRCHRRFGDDLPAIREHLNRELAELTETGEELQEDVEERQKRGEALRIKTDELESLVKRSYELAVKEKSLRNEVDDLQQRRGSASERAEHLAGQARALDGVTFDQDQYDRVSRQVADLEKARARALQLRGQVSDMPETRQSIRETEKRLAEIESEMARLEEQQGALDFNEAKFARVRDDFHASQQKLESQKEAYLKVTKELEVVCKEHEVRLAEMAQLDKAVKDLEECRTGQYYTEKLARLFADFRKFTISGIRPRLAQLSSELMMEMSGGKYNLVELDEDYNLRIMDYGQYYGIDRFSGGEKDLASLCLRLAISLALTESAGLDRSFVILDEVFGSQDSGRRDQIIQGLANLRNRFPQMLLITHLDELRHKVETLIEVIPTAAGWSEVRVNGKPA